MRTEMTVDVQEAMAILGCCRWKIYDLIRNGKLYRLPKVGKRVRFLRDDVARLAGSLRVD